MYGSCPHCGYCPHCGRGGQHTLPWLQGLQPYVPPKTTTAQNDDALRRFMEQIQKERHGKNSDSRQ